jgi:hypothetical protein
MTFDGTCERGGFQRAPQETEKIPPASSAQRPAKTAQLIAVHYALGTKLATKQHAPVGRGTRDRLPPPLHR